MNDFFRDIANNFITNRAINNYYDNLSDANRVQLLQEAQRLGNTYPDFNPPLNVNYVNLFGKHNGNNLRQLAEYILQYKRGI